MKVKFTTKLWFSLLPAWATSKNQVTEYYEKSTDNIEIIIYQTNSFKKKSRT